MPLVWAFCLGDKMKKCPNCDTYSIAGDDVCLNCHTRWKFTTQYYIGKRGWYFIIAFSLAILYCFGMALFWWTYTIKI